MTNSSSVSSFADHYSNPLYFSPGDNLSTPIVSVKLTNENYHVWSRSFSVALSIKNKPQFINSTSSIPDLNDVSYPAWNRCNFAVLSWMLNSVSEDIAQSLISYDKASLAWNDLKQRFNQCDAIRIADLQSRIASCDQGEATVTQYFTNLKVLWEEYLQYRPVPVCDCDPTPRVMLYQDQDYVIGFIRGLNDAFDVVRSQLLVMDPLPDINTVFKCVVQVERQMRGSVIRSVDSVALATNFQNKGKDPYSKGLFCHYCKKDNHSIEDCYRLKNKKAREASGGTLKSGFAAAIYSDAGGNGKTQAGGTFAESSSAPAERSVMANMSLTNDDIANSSCFSSILCRLLLLLLKPLSTLPLITCLLPPIPIPIPLVYMLYLLFLLNSI
ncbi:hypothetical protein LINPERPRIM_LOCUS35463 [Linum perenne]